MKRFLITSACTLVLSLLGSLGSNNDLLNLDKLLNNDTETTKVEGSITNIEDKQSLTGDDQTAANDNVAEASQTEVTEVTPAETPPQDTQKEDAKHTDNNTNVSKGTTSTGTASTDKATSNKVATKKEAVDNNAHKTVANTDTQNNTDNQNKVTATANTGAKSNTNTNNNQTVAQNSNQIYVYKNVDLSQCTSMSEVIAKLQSQGYMNINKSNVNNISGLEDILAMIQGGSNNTQSASDKQTTTATTPTKAPTSTSSTTNKKPATTTNPTPTKTPVQNNSAISNYASEVLRLVNIERQKAGLGSLTTNQTITAAANKRAQETVQSFSHTRPNGTSFSTVLKEYGISYRTCGENIAYGQKTPQEVVTGWMNSPGHRANILNANFNTIGIGVYQSNGVIYWTQLFTN